MSQRFLVGTRKGLFTFLRSGESWNLVRRDFLGVPVPMLLEDPRDGSLYAALDHGHFGNKMHASRDGGESWEEIGVPSYPKGEEGSEGESPALKMIWSLVPGGAEEPERLWCGTLPGGLFTSENKGASWQIVESLWTGESRPKWFGGGADEPGIHSICVDPRDSARILIGVSCGGIHITEDRGETWRISARGMRAEYMPPAQQQDEDIQDPHCVVQCREQPGHYWCQHHNGIWRSTDEGSSWEEIRDVQPSTFGFVVRVHPRDPDIAWVVPAQKDEMRLPVEAAVVVNRTRDGGKTWESLREGLPQQDGYDIVFRHALDLDAEGERLAMGSTTGNLWVSHDQGDRWRCLSHHLPPIYVVAFSGDSQ